MKSMTVIVGFLLMAGIASAQSHAATAEQCQADWHLWETTLQVDLTRIPYNELVLRAGEMNQCAELPSATQISREDFAQAWAYAGLESLYQSVAVVRLVEYLKRHGEASQFVTEDHAETDGK